MATLDQRLAASYWRWEASTLVKIEEVGVLAFAFSVLFLLRFFRAIPAIDFARLDSVCTRRARNRPQCRLRAQVADYAEAATADDAAEIPHCRPVRLPKALENLVQDSCPAWRGLKLSTPPTPQSQCLHIGSQKWLLIGVDGDKVD